MRQQELVSYGEREMVTDTSNYNGYFSRAYSLENLPGQDILCLQTRKKAAFLLSPSISEVIEQTEKTFSIQMLIP